MEKNKPLNRHESGRFQITTWRNQRAINANKDDSDPERERRIRACIEHSVFNKHSNEWNRQKIWMNAGELLDLATALDSLNGWR